MEKTSVATRSLECCFGCHISLLELHEELLGLFEAVDIKSSPLNDVKIIPQVALGILEGAVGNEENEHVAKEMRQKSKILVALGTCACFGGIPAMRNLHPVEEVLKRAYVESESTVEGKIPDGPEVPKHLRKVRALNQVIEVDYYIPGCPPKPKQILAAVKTILEGKAVVGPTHNLCRECDRYHKEMLIPQRGFVTDSVCALMELEQIDDKKCFLEQGVLCLGPATREGCGASCLKVNIPCRGCYGPPPEAMEQGSKMVNALASILPAGGLMILEDVVGSGYRYSLAVSIATDHK